MKIHTLDGYIQSIYLVEYPDKLLLLDGCCRADVGILKKFITESLNRPFSDLSLVVVTHMHPDHAGAAHKLRDITGCKIASAQSNEQWYAGVGGRLTHFVDVLLASWVAHRMGKVKKSLWYSPYLDVDYQLPDGAKLPGFADWSVVATPGHTDRDLSVFHTPSNCIYVADLIVKVKKRFIPPIPVYYPEQYRASLKAVEKLNPSSLLLAHGGEVALNQRSFEHLLTVAPSKPRTTWTPIKHTLKRLLMMKKS